MVNIDIHINHNLVVACSAYLVVCMCGSLNLLHNNVIRVHVLNVHFTVCACHLA